MNGVFPCRIGAIPADTPGMSLCQSCPSGDLGVLGFSPSYSSLKFVRFLITKVKKWLGRIRGAKLVKIDACSYCRT